MQTIVAAEHFKLTPAVKAQVDESLVKVAEILPDGVTVRVFLRMESPKVQLAKTHPGKECFIALYSVHVDGDDVVSTEAAEDLYQAIRQGATKLKRNIVSRRA